MTPEEIQQRLLELGPWFHCIDLGGGIKTKTTAAALEPIDHPAETWAKIARCLPAKLSGKSVLDVGCNAGFYAIEAKRRGAARVLGVDAQRHHVRQALFVRRVLGLNIEYRRMSVYDLTRSSVGVFDITLALGLIYHCKHLVLALERLYDVTRELLIIETAIQPFEKTPESFVDVPAGGFAMLHPLVYAENSPERKEAVFNWFLPSTAALEALLRNVGFTDINIFDLKRDRAIVLCRKTAASANEKNFAPLGAKLSLGEGPSVCPPNSPLRFHLLLENTGAARWSKYSEETRAGVRLGAHLFDGYGEEESWDYGRAELDKDLEPDEKTSVSIDLIAPGRPGKYMVEFDLVLENVTWFEELGTATVQHALEVI